MRVQKGKYSFRLLQELTFPVPFQEPLIPHLLEMSFCSGRSERGYLCSTSMAMNISCDIQQYTNLIQEQDDAPSTKEHFQKSKSHTVRLK